MLQTPRTHTHYPQSHWLVAKKWLVKLEGRAQGWLTVGAEERAEAVRLERWEAAVKVAAARLLRPAGEEDVVARPELPGVVTVEKQLRHRAVDP